MVKISPQMCHLHLHQSPFKAFPLPQILQSLAEPGEKAGCERCRYANVLLLAISASQLPQLPLAIHPTELLGWMPQGRPGPVSNAPCAAVLAVAFGQTWGIRRPRAPCWSRRPSRTHELFAGRGSACSASNLKLLGGVKVTRWRNEAFLCSLNTSHITWLWQRFLLPFPHQ